MTQNKEIQDLLYFKGVIDDYGIKLNELEKKEFDNNLTVLVSILN